MLYSPTVTLNITNTQTKHRLIIQVIIVNMTTVLFVHYILQVFFFINFNYFIMISHFLYETLCNMKWAPWILFPC